MVIYGIVTETNIGKLFAGRRDPGAADGGADAGGHRRHHRARPEHCAGRRAQSWPQRWRALRGIWGVLVLVLVGAGRHLRRLLHRHRGRGLRRGRAPSCSRWRGAGLTWAILYEVLVESARTTAMLFTLLIAATLFANFVNFTSMPTT
jgi:TRAP-type C4-dicarboxylate transport system permease large subunit